MPLTGNDTLDWILDQEKKRKEAQAAAMIQQAVQQRSIGQNAAQTLQDASNQSMTGQVNTVGAQAPQVLNGIMNRGANPAQAMGENANSLNEMNSAYAQSLKDRATRNQLIDALKTKLFDENGQLKDAYSKNKYKKGLQKFLEFMVGSNTYSPQGDYDQKLGMLKSLLESGDKNIAGQMRAETGGQGTALKGINDLSNQGLKAIEQTNKGAVAQQGANNATNETAIKDFLAKQKASQMEAQTKLINAQLPLISAKVGLTQAQTKAALDKVGQMGNNPYEFAMKLMTMAPEQAKAALQNLKDVQDTKPVNLHSVTLGSTVSPDEMGNAITTKQFGTFNPRTGQVSGGTGAAPAHPSTTSTAPVGTPAVTTPMGSGTGNYVDSADKMINWITKAPNPDAVQGLIKTNPADFAARKKRIQTWEGISSRNEEVTTTVLSSLANGTLDQYTGPLSYLTKGVRKYATNQSISEISRDMQNEFNTFQHIQGMVGARPSKGIVDDFKNVLEPQGETATNVVRRTLAQNLLVQLSSRMVKDPRFVNAMNDLEDAAREHPSKGGTIGEAIEAEINRSIQQTKTTHIATPPSIMRVIMDMSDKLKTGRIKNTYEKSKTKSALDQFLEDNAKD